VGDEQGLTGRLLKAVTGVLEKYAQEAKDEAFREVRRFIVGLFALMMSMVFMLHAAAMAHATVIASAVQLGAPLYAVLAGILAFDVMMVLFGLLMARLAIWRPLLPRTRRNFAEVSKVYKLVVG